jgi:heme-degrading monooxygenase HmoA
MPRILRIWRGETPAARAAEYLQRVTPIALADYRRIPGNRGAWVLSRAAGDVTQVMTVSLWDSMASIRAFAGDHPETAKYYDFDPEYLLRLAPEVEHWEVHDGDAE